MSREEVIAEAYTWLGTPYRHCGNLKGIGVDCLMLLVEVFRKPRGPVDLEYDPRPYSPEWYLHKGDEKYLAGMGEYAVRTDNPQIGDVAMFRFGRAAAHGAIIVSEELMIHAYMPHGNVELHERRALEDRFDSYWTCFP